MGVTSHTPGPWAVGSSDSPGYMGDLPRGSYYVADGRERVVAEIDSCGEPLPCLMADARLIAAAPELLVALEALLLSCDSDADWGRAQSQARSTIAKAKGEEVGRD
mgnify:CR=1 FL=1